MVHIRIDRPQVLKNLFKTPLTLRFYGFCQRCCGGTGTEDGAGFDRLNPNGVGALHLSPFALSLSKGRVNQIKNFAIAFGPELRRRVRPSGWGFFKSSLAALFIFGTSTALVQAQTVFACEPEWAALTRVLLPEAKVFVATHARQDPHHIEARPALIAQLRSADMAVCTGADLEAGWLPTLQQRAGNAKVQDGAPGMFYAADHVVLIDPQPGAVGSPFAGDVHAAGNPHLHTDPHRILVASQALSEQLQKLQPAQKLAIAKRQADFETAWKARITQWERRATPLRGREVVAQHSGYGYLWRWLGIKQVADLEPQPGMAPTPGHLQRLLTQLRPKPPLAVVVSSYQDPRSARWLVGQLGGNLPLLVLPATVMDASSTDALGLWFDQLLDELLKTVER